MPNPSDRIRSDAGDELAKTDREDPEREGGPNFELDLPDDSIFTESDYYEMFRVAANPLRHQILWELRSKGRLSTGEISRAVQKDANALHYHLRALKESALVQNRREPRSGTKEPYSYYSITVLGEIVLDEGIESGVQKLAAHEHQIQNRYSG